MAKQAAKAAGSKGKAAAPAEEEKLDETKVDQPDEVKVDEPENPAGEAAGDQQEQSPMEVLDSVLEAAKTAEAERTQRLLDAFRGDQSILDLQDYVGIPKLRIVQERTPARDWPEGSILLQPKGVLLCEAGDSVPIVPLLMFPRFVAWNDRDDTTSRHVHAESFDPSSAIALRARHHNDRIERYGSDGRFEREYVEHLVFIATVYAGEHVGSVFSLEFARGERVAGRRFCDAIANVSLDGRQVPMWGQVWNAQTEEIEKPKGTCQVLCLHHSDIVGPDEAEVFRERHEQFREQHRRRQLQVAD